MKPLILTLTLFLFALPAPAAEKIEGAFGLKLGDVFKPTTGAVSKLGYSDAFEFIPEKPNPALSTYLVFITPNSHLIYQSSQSAFSPTALRVPNGTRRFRFFYTVSMETARSEERIP